jgi:hypothetical protein
VIGKVVHVDDDHLVFTLDRAGAEAGAAPVMRLAYTRKP